MTRTGPFSTDPAPDPETDAAWAWLARRDRGLTESETRDFAAWLAADRRRAELLRSLEEPFRALDRAAALRAPEMTPDPDFLLKLDAGRTAGDVVAYPATGARRARRFPFVATGFAAAALVVFGWVRQRPDPPSSPATVGAGYVARHAPREERLADGSKVELKGDAAMQVAFSPTERRVLLDRGDAHFTVARDVTRPFVVVARGVAVRAVGTAFTVSQAAAGLEVVVWEGKVRVDDLQGRSLIAPPPVAEPAALPPPERESILAVGQRVVIPATPGDPVPVPVGEISADEMARAFEWRRTWLEFVQMPLAQVVSEFARHAPAGPSRRIRLADTETERVVVSGKFRPDEIDTFVRLLASGFDVASTIESDGSLTLRKLR